MNGFIEPLPGLLDDPQFQIPNLPSLPDVHIAPLRNPAPSKHGNAPLPLEPFSKLSEDHRHGARNATQLEDEPEKTSPPRLKPSDVLSAREAKKPHLAISELLETNNDADPQNLQLPSFVSLAVVEKSPVQEPSYLSPHKRPRLDIDAEVSSREVGRRLPRPAQKDDKQARRVPLLPAMVTGLHEPPPSAGILPSMELDARPNLLRTNKTSKMQVKDMLAEAKQSTHVPPEAMLNSPAIPCVRLANNSRPEPDEPQYSNVPNTSQIDNRSDLTEKRDFKTRRTRRKWSEEETSHLVEGVKKHGFGKWKLILNDEAFKFHDRTSIDLKDRYRVYAKDHPELYPSPAPSQPPPAEPFPTSQPESAVDGEKRAKRKRRPWTPQEDEALMRGVAKHGFLWTIIHDDEELNLQHRRATDLRDRIRNLYPEGYKHAEARPFRSDAKRAEKLINTINATPPRIQPQTQPQPPMNGSKATINASHETTTTLNHTSPSRQRDDRRKTHKSGGDNHPTVEQVGVTLPSIALDDDDELDWGNTTLPPLVEWEDIGI